MTTPLTPPADAVARLTGECRGQERLNNPYCEVATADLRALLAAYGDAARDRERMANALALLATDECYPTVEDDGSVGVYVLTNDIWAPAADGAALAPEEYAAALAAHTANPSTGLLRFIATRDGLPMQTWRGGSFDALDAVRTGEAR